jgi:hypothetical protein
MKRCDFHRYPTFQDSSDSLGKLPKQSLLTVLVLGFVFVAAYAVFAGGTVTTELTHTHIRVEIVGKPK